MTDIRDQIIDAALSEAVFDGWTQGTLARAAERAGLSAADAKRVFPNPVDALNYHSRRGDQRMLDTLTTEYNLPSMKIRERIATAVMVRLRQNQPHREAIRRAIATFALPWHAADGMKNLYATVDAMWHAAGDTSTRLATSTPNACCSRRSTPPPSMSGSTTIRPTSPIPKPSSAAASRT